MRGTVKRRHARRLHAVLVALTAVGALATGFPSAQEKNDTVDKDWLSVVSKAPGVPEGSVFSEFEGEEQVSLLNGNLTIRHASSPSLPLEGGGSVSLVRVYNSKSSRVDEVHWSNQPDGSAFLYRDFPHGQSWVGRGWAMHLGRVYRKPVHNWLLGPQGAYATYDLYFEDATGTQHQLRENGVAVRIAASPILEHEWRPQFANEWVCEPPGWVRCLGECCENGTHCVAGEEPGVTCSCDCQWQPVDQGPAHHEVTLPDGTVYELGFEVPEELLDEGWIRNGDRAGWYVTRITDVHGNVVEVDYFGWSNPRFPEGIAAIRSRRLPEATPRTLIWTEVWDDGGADGVDDRSAAGWDPRVAGAVRFVRALGPNGSVAQEFLYEPTTITDPVGTRDFPLLEEVRLPAATGGGESVGSYRYAYEPITGQTLPSRLTVVEYPTGGASEYEWTGFLAGRRAGARCAEEILGLDDAMRPRRCEDVGRRLEPGVRTRKVYPEGRGAGKPHATWTWSREFWASEGCFAVTSNRFEMTQPDGTKVRATVLGHPCGDTWATGFEGWESGREYLSAEGAVLRSEAYTYSAAGEHVVHGSKIATEVLKKMAVVTYHDDVGGCFGGPATRPAATHVTRWYGRDAKNHWQLERTQGSYLAGSHLRFTRYAQGPWSRHVLDRPEFVFTQEGNRRIESKTTYTSSGLPLTTVLRGDETALTGSCASPDEGAAEETWEAWASSVSGSCGPPADTSEDVVTCRTWGATGNPTATRSAPGGQGEPCGSASYGATYESAYGRVVAARLDGMGYDAARVSLGPSGHVAASTDPNGRVTVFTHDDLGRLTRIDPPGTVEWPTRVVYPDLRTMEAFSSGGEETAFDPSNASQTWTRVRFDGLGRTTESWKALPDGTRAVRVIGRDEMGRTVFTSEWMTEAEWIATPTTTWTGRDRDGDGLGDYSVTVPMRSDRPWGAVTFYGTPDPTDPGNPLAAAADAFGRVHRVDSADGAYATTSYCGPHQETVVPGIATDADNRSTTGTATYRSYEDGLGRLVLVDGPADGADAEYRHDLGGRLTRANLVAQLPNDPLEAWKSGTIATGQLRTFVFDGLGRLEERTTPEGGVDRVLRRDVWGRPLESQDALGGARGFFFRSSYDAAGRLVLTEKVLGSPSSPATSDEVRLGSSGDFDDVSDVGAGAWELGTIDEGTSLFVPGGSAWHRQAYASLGCVAAPPGQASGGSGLYLGSGCSYSGVSAIPQAARHHLAAAKRDDTLELSFWRQVREGPGDRDALEVFATLGATGNSVASKRTLLRLDETQTSYARWQAVRGIRLGDVFTEAEWPEGTTADVDLHVVFRKGDAESSGLGTGVMIDDVWVGRHAVETVAATVYDEDACPGAGEACSGGEETANAHLGRVTRQISYAGGHEVARKEFVYKGLNGRVSGVLAVIDWTGVGDASAWVTRTSWEPSGSVEEIVAPYLPGIDEARTYGYATRRGGFDGVHGVYRGAKDWFVAPGTGSVTFNAAGGVSRLEFTNGASTIVEGDARHRTARIRVDGPAAGGGRVDLWDSGAYVYDGRGNISAIGTQSFGYDLVGRLREAILVSQANPNTLGQSFRETYEFDLVGNMISRDWERIGSLGGGVPPAGAQMSRSFPATLATNENRPTDSIYRFDANGNTMRLRGSDDGPAAATWDDGNRMTSYYIGAPEQGGRPAERYTYDAAGGRLTRSSESGDGRVVITVRDGSGQAASEYVVDPASGRPVLSKDFVYGSGRLLVERKAVTVVPGMAGNSTIVTGGEVGLTLTSGDGSGSYALDIRTESGYTHHVTGIVPSGSGQFSIPEAAVSAGESNWLRVRGEGDGKAYSAAVTVASDPRVVAGSSNQVKWLSVTRTGPTVTLRWQLLTSNGKRFRVYFTRRDTGQALPLTPGAGLGSGVRSLTLTDQALSASCGVFAVSQTLSDGSNETATSVGVGLPPSGASQDFAGTPGTDCESAPPPSPGGTFVNGFHHRDHLGSLRVVTDAGGWRVSGHDFAPFGMEVLSENASATGPSRMRFTGHERDVMTGLDYMQARYGGWFQGSFLTPDPGDDVDGADPQSWNRYAYVRNNPLNLVDPKGMASDGVAQTEGEWRGSQKATPEPQGVSWLDQQTGGRSLKPGEVPGILGMTKEQAEWLALDVGTAGWQAYSTLFGLAYSLARQGRTDSGELAIAAIPKIPRIPLGRLRNLLDDAARGVTRVTGPALQAARREFDQVVKPAYWKEYAKHIDDGVISNPFGGHADNLARMRDGQPPIGPDGLSVNLHHIQPLSYGGTNAFDNLVPINATTHQQMFGVLHTPPFR